jgi:hypothetical protein
MNFGCALGGHSPRPGETYNSGYYFSACRRCSRPLVRTAHGGWQSVPAGHRLVWRSGSRSHSLEADYAGVLPIVRDEASLPAARSPFVSRNRSMIRLRATTPEGARAGTPEESGDYECPRPLLMAVVLAAGLRMLLNFAAGR